MYNLRITLVRLQLDLNKVIMYEKIACKIVDNLKIEYKIVCKKIDLFICCMIYLNERIKIIYNKNESIIYCLIQIKIKYPF